MSTDTKTREWSITVRAFDRIVTRRYFAETFDEAVERALDDVHLSVKGSEVRDPMSDEYEPPVTQTWHFDEQAQS